MNQPDPVDERLPLPRTAEQSLELLRTMYSQTASGQIEEIAIVGIKPDGDCIICFSETENIHRMAGALMDASLQRMGFVKLRSLVPPQ